MSIILKSTVNQILQFYDQQISGNWGITWWHLVLIAFIIMGLVMGMAGGFVTAGSACGAREKGFFPCGFGWFPAPGNHRFYLKDEQRAERAEKDGDAEVNRTAGPAAAGAGCADGGVATGDSCPESEKSQNPRQEVLVWLHLLLPAEEFFNSSFVRTLP